MLFLKPLLYDEKAKVKKQNQKMHFYKIYRPYNRPKAIGLWYTFNLKAPRNVLTITILFYNQEKTQDVYMLLFKP